MGKARKVRENKDENRLKSSKSIEKNICSINSEGR